MAGKKRAAPPTDLLIQVEREAVIRQATAILIQPAPEGVAVLLEKGAFIEPYLTLEADIGSAFTRHVIERSAETHVIEAKLPEGRFVFDVEAKGEVLVLRRRPDAPASVAAPAPVVLPTAEAEDEQVLDTTTSSNEDSAIVALASQLLLALLGEGLTAFRIDPSGTSDDVAVEWEGASAPANMSNLSRVMIAPLLRRLLVMADLSFTRRTEGLIRLRHPRGMTELRVTRGGTGDAGPLRVERIAEGGGATAQPPASATRRAPGTVVARVRSPMREAVDEHWGTVESELVFDASLAPGLKGLDAFTHVLVVFWMEKSGFAPADLVRRPRGREDMPPVGIFAQRAKDRPNPIGITAVKIEGVDVEKGILRVQGLDAIDGTPVLDVKPYVPAFDRAESARVPDWMDALMKGYF